MNRIIDRICNKQNGLVTASYKIVNDFETSGEKQCSKLDRENEKIYSKLLSQAEKARNAIKNSGLSMNLEVPIPPRPSNRDRFILWQKRNVSKKVIEQSEAILYLQSKGYKYNIHYEAYQAIDLAIEVKKQLGDEYVIKDNTTNFENVYNKNDQNILRKRSMYGLSSSENESNDTNNKNDKIRYSLCEQNKNITLPIPYLSNQAYSLQSQQNLNNNSKSTNPSHIRFYRTSTGSDYGFNDIDETNMLSSSDSVVTRLNLHNCDNLPPYIYPNNQNTKLNLNDTQQNIIPPSNNIQFNNSHCDVPEIYPRRTKSLSSYYKPSLSVRDRINSLNNRHNSIIFPNNYTNIENNNKFINNIKPIVPPASMVIKNTIPTAPPLNNNDILLNNN